MCIVEFYKIIFESRFFQTRKSNSCCVHSVFFCQFIFLKFCFRKCCFQFFFQTCFCRNNDSAGIAYSIGNETAICRNDLCILGICHHSHMTFLAMDTWEAGIRCETAGKLFCYLIVMFHTFGTCFLVTSHNETYSFVQLHT